MEFPVTLTFKILAIGSKIFARNATGQEICFVKKKKFKLKEEILVYTDSTQNELLCSISADRIIDFSANYTFRDKDGNSFGNIRRQGMRSFWKASYEIQEDGHTKYTITEANPWSKVADAVLDGIPVVGLASNYLFHPRFEIRDGEGNICYTLKKEAALFEGKFTLNEHVQRDDDVLVLMSVLMMVLLERGRG